MISSSFYKNITFTSVQTTVSLLLKWSKGDQVVQAKAIDVFQATILVVDDQPDIRHELASALKEYGYICLLYTSDAADE